MGKKNLGHWGIKALKTKDVEGKRGMEKREITEGGERLKTDRGGGLRKNEKQ